MVGYSPNHVTFESDSCNSFVESPVLLDWKCAYGSNPLRDFNGNQNSGLILIELSFDIDAELFKPVEGETVLSISRSGALGSREL